MMGITKLKPWAWYGLGMAAMTALFAFSHVGGQSLVLPIVFAGIAIGLFFVGIGWIRSDETTKEAHKVAWWHGGNFGIVVAMMLLLALPVLPGFQDAITDTAQAWRSRVALQGDATLAAFALGAMFVIVFQMTGYAVTWAGWWIAKR